MTDEDIRNIKNFKDQTLIAIKAPSGTTLGVSVCLSVSVCLCLSVCVPVCACVRARAYDASNIFFFSFFSCSVPRSFA